ncbi:MAG: hypothetical protein OEY03_11310, partial [Rhizobacter sp.]|nr:hypothetical protein [Rhizobacter sp.]
RGRPLRDDHFVLLFNAAAESVTFSLPARLGLGPGELLIDTTDAVPHAGTGFDPAAPYALQARALALARFSTRKATT